MTSVASSAPHRVAIVGGSLSGNKGAASMVQAVVDRLPEMAGPCEFAVLSAYAADDRQETVSRRDDTEIVDWSPPTMIAAAVMAALAALLRAAGLPWRWLCQTAALRTLRDADVVVDVSGISFVDGRGAVVLAYNVLLVSVPLLLGRRVVKCAQAMGPFHEPLNRVAARLVFPRLAHVIARGDQTLQHLHSLRLGNVGTAPDLAFALDTPTSVAGTGASRWPDRHGVRAAVVPSTVVASQCRAVGIDYERLIAAFVERILQRGHAVVLLPHSARPGRPEGHTNDLPLCRRIAARLADAQGWRLVEDGLSPHELRSVIEAADILVAGRFHAMISGLATATPPVVTGWSHKYTEVLVQFGLERQQLPYDSLDVEHLVELYEATEKLLPDITARIASALPPIRSAAIAGLQPVADELVG